MCVCASVRLCVCASVRLCGCAAVRLCGCAAGVPAYLSTGVPPHRRTAAPTHILPGALPAKAVKSRLRPIIAVSPILGSDNSLGIAARWRRLSRAERRDLRAALWRLLVVAVLMRLVGVGRSQRWLERKQPQAADEVDLAPWRRRALALKRVGARLPGVHCLARSIALWWWMGKAGLDASVCIGVRKGDKEIEGHAWVELNGTPVDETPACVASYQRVAWDHVRRVPIRQGTS